MTNEELRTKIVEILEETEYEWTEEKNGYILQIFYDKLADALIAAGLTFDGSKNIPKGNYCKNCKNLVTHKFPLLELDGEKDTKYYAAETKCALYDQYVTAVAVLDGNKWLDEFEKCPMCKLQAEKELAEGKKE